MEEDKKEKGFVIRDRRFSVEEEKRPEESGGRGEQKEETRAEGDKKETDAAAYPEIDFANFIVSLSSSVLFHFGDLPDPVTGKSERDLHAAKQAIDILAMLQEKTRGNLNGDEQKLIDGVLFELRMRYVKEKGKG